MKIAGALDYFRFICLFSRRGYGDIDTIVMLLNREVGRAFELSLRLTFLILCTRCLYEFSSVDFEIRGAQFAFVDVVPTFSERLAGKRTETKRDFRG